MGSKILGLNFDYLNCGELNSVEKVIFVEGLENLEECEFSVKADGYFCVFIYIVKDIIVNLGVFINGMKEN